MGNVMNINPAQRAVDPRQVMVNAVLNDPKAFASVKCECGGYQFDRVNIFKQVPATHPANPSGQPFEVGVQATVCRACGRLLDRRLEE